MSWFVQAEPRTGGLDSPSEVELKASTSAPETSALALKFEPPVLVFPRRPTEGSFIAEAQWEGYVEVIRDGYFEARLVDPAGKRKDEYAEILLDSVTKDDRKLVVPGAVFYWSVGIHESERGDRSYKSVIRFRRLPAWTQAEIAAARKRGYEIAQQLGWREKPLGGARRRRG
jgi:hypothetical protein